jgi:hypothetical protein
MVFFNSRNKRFLDVEMKKHDNLKESHSQRILLDKNEENMLIYLNEN